MTRVRGYGYGYGASRQWQDTESSESASAASATSDEAQVEEVKAGEANTGRRVSFKEEVLVITDTTREVAKLSKRPKRRFKEPPAPKRRKKYQKVAVEVEAGVQGLEEAAGTKAEAPQTEVSQAEAAGAEAEGEGDTSQRPGSVQEAQALEQAPVPKPRPEEVQVETLAEREANAEMPREAKTKNKKAKAKAGEVVETVEGVKTGARDTAEVEEKPKKDKEKKEKKKEKKEKKKDKKAKKEGKEDQDKEKEAKEAQEARGEETEAKGDEDRKEKGKEKEKEKEGRKSGKKQKTVHEAKESQVASVVETRQPQDEGSEKFASNFWASASAEARGKPPPVSPFDLVGGIGAAFGDPVSSSLSNPGARPQEGRRRHRRHSTRHEDGRRTFAWPEWSGAWDYPGDPLHSPFGPPVTHPVQPAASPIQPRPSPVSENLYEGLDGGQEGQGEAGGEGEQREQKQYKEPKEQKEHKEQNEQGEKDKERVGEVRNGASVDNAEEKVNGDESDSNSEVLGAEIPGVASKRPVHVTPHQEDAPEATAERVKKERTNESQGTGLTEERDKGERDEQRRELKNGDVGDAVAKALASELRSDGAPKAVAAPKAAPEAAPKAALAVPASPLAAVEAKPPSAPSPPSSKPLKKSGRAPAARKSAPTPPPATLRGPADEDDSDWEAGDSDLQMSLRAALGGSDDEVIQVTDASAAAAAAAAAAAPAPTRTSREWPTISWPENALEALKLKLPKAVCWQASSIKSQELRRREAQRTQGGAAIGVESPEEATSRESREASTVKRGIRLAGEWRPPPPLRLPPEIPQWSSAAYRGTELAARSNTRKAVTEVGIEYTTKLVALMRNLESHASEPASLLRLFWSTLSLGERARFAREFPQFQQHLPLEGL